MHTRVIYRRTGHTRERIWKCQEVGKSTSTQAHQTNEHSSLSLTGGDMSSVLKVTKLHSKLKWIVSRDFWAWFFSQTLPPGPSRHPKKQNWFNTVIEELSDFKIDSPVYSLPQSLDSPVYSPLGSFNSPMYSPPRSLDFPVGSPPGSHILIPRFIHCRRG